MSKSTIVRTICSLLGKQLTVMQAAAEEARQNATGDETRSEGKYDTRAIEASYLAGAQSEQADRIADAISALKGFEPASYDEEGPIQSGALVETEHGGHIVFYLLAPAGGGVTVEHEGFDCTVLAPDSSLYQNLLGAHVGDVVGDIDLVILGVS